LLRLAAIRLRGRVRSNRRVKTSRRAARPRTASTADCTACLRATDCWPSLPAATTQAQAQRLPTLLPGAPLWRQGDAFGGLFIVTQGCLKLVERAPDGTETVAGFRFPGDLLGLEALADGLHADEAVALEPLGVCRIDWDRTAEADRYAALDRELLVRQACETRRLRAQRRSLHRGAVAALSDCLAEIRDALGIAPQQSLRLPMSGADLASFLGVADATISRALRQLEQRGVLERRGRELYWTNVTAIQRGRRTPRVGSASSGFSGQ
jgi:CRP/FNR family transcriptional regulator